MGIDNNPFSNSSQIAYNRAVQAVDECASRGLTSLDLSFLPALEQIPSLKCIQRLHGLNVSKTKIKNLLFLGDIEAVAQLNISSTNVVDLTLLKRFKDIQSLMMRDTRVFDLSPLSEMHGLLSINIRDTNVRDLSPLAHLPKLRQITLTRTKVVDVSPLSGLLSLRSLNLRRTRVDDISSLSDLRLESLDISDTRVSDLSSLAQMTDLVPAAAVDLINGGLKFEDCPLLDFEQQALSKLSNPERTLTIFNNIRARAGLPPHGPAVPAEEPKIPPQGVGPHFAIDRGLVTFSQRSGTEEIRHETRLLEQIRPLLKEMVAEAIENLGRGNKPHASVLEILRRYDETIGAAIEAMQFGRLFGYGLRLQNAVSAARRAAVEGELPSLTETQCELLDSLLDLHGPFILQSADGRALIEAEGRYHPTDSDQAELKNLAINLTERLDATPNVVDAEVAEYLVSAARDIGMGAHPRRSGLFGELTISNVSRVLVAGAALYVLSTGTGGVAATILVVTTIIGNKGIENSKLGQLGTRKTTELIDNNTKQIYKFVVNNDEIFRKLSERRKDFRWLSRALSWIKAGEDRKIAKETNLAEDADR